MAFAPYSAVAQCQQWFTAPDHGNNSTCHDTTQLSQATTLQTTTQTENTTRLSVVLFWQTLVIAAGDVC